MLAEIFSFIPGPKMIHKVALVSNSVRKILIKNKRRLYFEVRLKVEAILLKPITIDVFLCEDNNENSTIFDRLGVKLQAYKAILWVANRVKLVCTDENYINILKVIQLLHVHNTYIHLEYKSNFLLPGVFRRMLIDLNLTFV